MKAPKEKSKQKSEIETEPDGWQRFQDAVHKIAPPRKTAQKDSSAKKS